MTVEQSPEISIIPIQTETTSNKYPKNNSIKIILLVILGLIIVVAIGVAGYAYLSIKLTNAELDKSCLNDSDCVLVTQKKECCAHPQAVNQKELTNNKQIIKYPFLLEIMLPRYPWCNLVKCKEYNVLNPKAVCQSSKCTIISAKYTSPTPTPNDTANWKTFTNGKYGFEVKYYPELTPNEYSGGNETTGQFTYLQSILFGTGLTGGNYIKSPYGFEAKIKNKSSLENFRSEIIGHVADKIDSEEEVEINDNTWEKINYQIFVTTNYVPVTSAITNNDKYSYEITASKLDIDQILSTFKFTNQASQNQTKFTCPQNGWVDCMPIMDEAKILACSSEAETWYKVNCPNFQGLAQ